MLSTSFSTRGLANIKVGPRRGPKVDHQTVTFTRDVIEPCTIVTEEPVAGPRVSFSVNLPVKEGRTAIGFQAEGVEPSKTYLTPEFQGVWSKAKYLTLGGAGFIYPMKHATKCTYGRGNTLRVDLDLEKETISFSVDGKPACSERWLYGGTSAWPSISVESGEVRCEVTWHDC